MPSQKTTVDDMNQEPQASQKDQEDRMPSQKTTVDDMNQEPQASQKDQLDETLTEEDVQFLNLLENGIEHKEKRVKLKEKKSKHRRTDDKCLREGEDADIFSDSSRRSRRKKKVKNRAAIACDENCLPQEVNKASDCLHSSDPFEAPLKIKRKKQPVPPEIQASANPPTSSERHRPAPENITGGKRKKKRNKEMTIDPTCEATSKNDDGNSQQRKKHPLSLHQGNMAMYTSTSPGANPNTKYMNGMSDHSQDLFITQKQFLSSRGSSEDSPPLGQEQGQEWMRSQNPLHRFSQLSFITRHSADRSGVGSNQQVVLSEKATQTDDGFTYLALMSFIKKVKVLEPCSAEAIDLSLPSRVRAKMDVSPSNEVILVKSQSPPLGSRRRNIKFCFSPLQNIAETKFVQTVLNASYFFKGKGDAGEATPITPLLKMEEKPRKKSRKSGVHTKKNIRN
ncbi:G patch domain-containing protein 8-like [Bufo gargarizans]|uniref:G patch domain-containing protein 8-like n=1 Tax=Bufo gargarizans TaxID=30331 RepID=UPI001CF3D36E|nr:G patch domain-containing protein 8-like [Bufo gargarizans]